MSGPQGSVGWGGAKHPSERQADTILVESVEDHGGADFCHALQGPDRRVFSWRTPMPPSNGHQILVWSDLSQEPRRFGANEISSQKDDTCGNSPAWAP